ncbi:Peptidyl-tRNA hydrolase [Bienertia sinuspersici]
MSSLPSKEQVSKTLTLLKPPYKRSDHDPGYAHTACLVEVFQICIDKFDETERQGEIYGLIEVVELDGIYTLYDRDRGNPEHIRANSTISLTGPHRAISSVLGFGINVDLYLCGNGGEDIIEEHVLGKWQLSWDIMDSEVARITYDRLFQHSCDRGGVISLEADVKHQSAGYDKPLCANLEGLDGRCITMYYAIFKHAVQVWVQVELIDSNADPYNAEYDVRGTITSSYSHFECGNNSSFKDHCKTTLWRTKDLESVKLKRWKKIQLSRCFVVVPVYASFVIEADLWDSSSHLAIAKGKVEFTPNHLTLGCDYIRGDGNNAIRVMVAWSYKSRVPGTNPF